jgi:DNA-binding MarR family transcriptional regulator
MTDIPAPHTDKQAVKAWLSVVRAYHQCDAAMASRLAALGVRTAEHEILANLVREPGVSQQTLAARCFTAKSHVSTLLRTMEARGWVRREADPGDARARRLFVTRSGEALARRTLAVQAEIVQAMARSVPAKELALIEAAMTRVSERLEGLTGVDPGFRRDDSSSTLPSRRKPGSTRSAR